ncbi:MAG: MerR family transcriptional regulator [Spirochaetales bacterium]|nr:MerR family transcriptional regulator [Spirochaetales bacterium]
MYIGHASKLTGATPKAIRLYERMGLIPAPQRKGRYRVYTEGDIQLIGVIKKAQSLGFRLSEMKGLVYGSSSCDDFPWDRASAMVSRKMRAVDAQIERLQTLNGELHRFAALLDTRRCSDP